MLVNGSWRGEWQPIQAADEVGRFLRHPSTVRNWVTPDGRPGLTGVGGFPAEAGRYRLFVHYLCPWAHRTLLARRLKGLEELVPVTILSPVIGAQGWEYGGFEGAGEDPLHGDRYLHQLYTRHDPAYTGRATVPVLWDCRRKMMVSNESADILRMFNGAFAAFGSKGPDLCPSSRREEIEHWNPRIYECLNNGVYRAGFASTQQAYEEAVAEVFATLDLLETHFGDGRRFLLGEGLSESDLRLCVTLVRFDVAYHGLFKCNLRRLADYPRLSAYLERFLHVPGVWETVRFAHIKVGYYSIRKLNPSGIVPVGPAALFSL